MFDVLVAEHEAGWPAIHVRVKNRMRPNQFEDNQMIVCLTVDAIEPEEFDAYVDELIEQLEALKTKGRKTLDRIKKRGAS